MTDLEPYFGKASMKVNDIEFKLVKEEEMSGELAVWSSKDYLVRATPNFDNIPIPVYISTPKVKINIIYFFSAIFIFPSFPTFIL